VHAFSIGRDGRVSHLFAKNLTKLGLLGSPDAPSQKATQKMRHAPRATDGESPLSWSRSAVNSIPRNPHDAFFREVFSEPRHVIKLLRLVLPARVRRELDTRWLKENPRATHLPPMIPVLVCDGVRPRRSATRLRHLIDLRGLPRDAGLLAMMRSLRVVLADLAHVSEALLETLQVGPRTAAPTLFDVWTTRLAPLRDAPAGGSTICAALWNLFSVSAMPKDRTIAAVEALPEPDKERFMTGAQQGIAEGRKLGQDEGRRAAIDRDVQRGTRLGSLSTRGAALRSPADGDRGARSRGIRRRPRALARRHLHR